MRSACRVRFPNRTPNATQKRKGNGLVDECAVNIGIRILVVHGVSDVSVKSVWELVNKFFCATKTGGFTNLVAIMCERGLPSPIFSRICVRMRYIASDVCEDEAHRKGEVRITLEEYRHCSAKVCESKGFNITVVNKNCTLHWVVDAGDKIQDRALSRAIRANNDLQ
jgi:hypothetical protein